jgi:hypothetical protein
VGRRRLRWQLVDWATAHLALTIQIVTNSPARPGSSYYIAGGRSSEHPRGSTGAGAPCATTNACRSITPRWCNDHHHDPAPRPTPSRRAKLPQPPETLIYQPLSLDELSTEHRDGITMVLTAGQHLLTLLDDILDLSHLEDGHLSTSVEPIPVTTLITDALNLSRPLADAGGVRLSGPPLRPPACASPPSRNGCGKSY